MEKEKEGEEEEKKEEKERKQGEGPEENLRAEHEGALFLEDYSQALRH